MEDAGGAGWQGCKRKRGLLEGEVVHRTDKFEMADEQCRAVVEAAGGSYLPLPPKPKRGGGASSGGGGGSGEGAIVLSTTDGRALFSVRACVLVRACVRVRTGMREYLYSTRKALLGCCGRTNAV